MKLSLTLMAAVLVASYANAAVQYNFGAGAGMTAGGGSVNALTDFSPSSNQTTLNITNKLVDQSQLLSGTTGTQQTATQSQQVNLQSLGNGQSQDFLAGVPNSIANIFNAIGGNGTQNLSLGNPVVNLTNSGIQTNTPVSNVVFNFGTTGATSGMIRSFAFLEAPEPATAGLMGGSLLLLGLLRRKKRSGL
ncbi:MAG: PEP-CTERM sorting domain-containing protein [Bryobacteraceae bacterium]